MVAHKNTHKFKRCDEVVFEILDDNICIFNEKIASYLMLNNTGSFIWKCLEKPMSLKELYNSAEKSYDFEDTTKISKEIDEFIHESINLGILIEVNS